MGCHFLLQEIFLTQGLSPSLLHGQVEFFVFNFLIEEWMLYRISWFSVIHQQESAIGTPMSPPSRTPCPRPSPSRPSACRRAPVWVPWVVRQIPTGYLFHLWCTFLRHPPHTSPLPLFSSARVHRSVLCVCFSIAAGRFFTAEPPGKPIMCLGLMKYVAKACTFWKKKKKVSFENHLFWRGDILHELSAWPLIR